MATAISFLGWGDAYTTLHINYTVSDRAMSRSFLVGLIIRISLSAITVNWDLWDG